MFRQNTYTEGGFGQLIPLSRQAVVPGQSVAIDLGATFETPPFLQNVLTGGVAHLYAFYVPYRLVWDQWVDFISDPDSSLSVPSVTDPWDWVFEANPSRPTSVLGRRSYKLIWNQFFGDADTSASFYSDLELDTDKSIYQAKTLDQFRGRMMQSGNVGSTDMSLPVTGAPAVATLNLDDLRKQLSLSRSDRKARMTGEKYVDAMARMGVKLDWRVQNAPEFLGQAMVEFGPKDTKATYTAADPAPGGSAVVGRSYSKYGERLSLKTPRRFFAEHGLIWTGLMVRPHVWPGASLSCPDAEVYQRQDFFLGDNQSGTDAWPAAALGFTGVVYTERFAHLLNGENMFGRRGASPWAVYGNLDSFARQVFPSASVPADSAQITAAIAVAGRYSASGPNPVRRKVF